MTCQALGYQAPVAHAISEGATAPNPGLPGVQVWSTTTSSLMVWNGATWNAMGDAARQTNQANQITSLQNAQTAQSQQITNLQNSTLPVALVYAGLCS